MGYQNILIPLDGSKLSELSLEHILQIAAPRARVHILSVLAGNPSDEVASLASAKAYSIPSADVQWPQVKDADPHDPHARETYLKGVAEWLQGAGFHVTTEAVPGDAIETILATSQRGFDVIVMASHRRSGTSKMVLGSVASAVLQDAPCPVLVVPAHVAKS